MAKSQSDMTAAASYIARSVPMAYESEQEMAKEAPRAVKTLKKNDALDLAEMLGLTPYLEGETS